MKLDFSLLIVDDEADSYRQAIIALKDHLEVKGFFLQVDPVTDFSKENLTQLTEQEGKNFDLVAIDYDLGTRSTDGAKIAHKLRQSLPYTDMVFYSSLSTVDLLHELAENRVSGVFVETRDTLDEALVKLADTVIGKAVDLTHMRGVAMAEVAEMDVIMDEALACFFKSGDEIVSEVMDRTKHQILQDAEDKTSQVKGKLRQGGLQSVVDDVTLFSSYQRYRTIRRAAKKLHAQPKEELEKLTLYDKNIIAKRNMLAHAKEETRDDGTIILRSARRNREDVVIDDLWMSNFRMSLKEYREALTIVCNALKAEFSPSCRACDPQ